MGDEGGDGPQWVDRTKRPKPAPLESDAQEVSRASGLTFSTGTFGKQRRFPKEVPKGEVPKMTGPGSQSPSRELYYSRNALYKTSLEEPPSTSLGIGPRPGMEKSGPSSVGPGSYNIVHSAAGPRSPLDGPEFCATTIKVKLPSSLVAHAMPSPGPHARYEVRGDLNRHLPTYAKHKPLLGHGRRRAENEEDKDPGPGAYQTHTYNATAINASCPNLLGGGQGCMEATGGSKRCLKSTFGMSQRFPKDKVPNSSPQGDRYYAHSKILDKEDYLNGVRSCSFGASGKTDMAKLHSNSDVSPVTYRPEQGYSAVYATSPLDGGTNRCASPVAVFSKGAGSAKHSTKSRRSPHMLKGAGGSLSTGALSAGAASLDA